MNYPTKQELRSSRAAAIAVLIIMAATLIAIAVMLTMQLTGFAAFPISAFVAVFFGGLLAIVVGVAIGSRKPKGRAQNITDHHIFNSKELS